MATTPFNGDADAGRSAAPMILTEMSEDGGTLPPVLLQYWQIALRWRWVIGGIIVGALILGLVLTLLMSPRYTARAQIEISREQKNVTSVEGLESSDSGRDLEFYATQYALLKADSLAQRVARKLNLAERPAFFAAHGADMPGAEGVLGNAGGNQAADRDARQRLAVQLLLNNLDIAPIRGSSLVDVLYTSRDPALSAEISNAWVQQFIASTMDREFSSTADARRFLEQRLATLRARLEQSERDLVTYAAQRDIVQLNTIRNADGVTQTQQTLASADLEALNSALAAARAERVAAESRANMSGGAGASPEALSNPAINSLRQRRAEVAAEYAKLLVQFEPGYPEARALKSQMDSLDAAINRETDRVSGSRTKAYREALQQERELESQVNALKARLDRQHRDSIQLNIYQREADTNRQLYDALLQRYKEIGVAGTVGASNIAVVDVAQVPTKPSAPNLMLNLALALLAGTVIAAAVTVGLEQIDEGIRHPSDVRQKLGLPLLGNVPMATGDPVEELADPKSHLAEAYFSTRSTLAFATSHGLPRSFTVTSTRSGEGKSTSAFALAATIGRTGKSVLLVDGDMRSPSVHKFLGVENGAGLSNLLTGDEDFAALVRPTGFKGLSAMVAGPAPPSAAELLSTDRMHLIIQKLLAQFDHVVIDSPPVLGLTDAPLLGRSVEGCVFVIEAEGAAVRAIRSSLDRMRMVDNHIYGAIVTKIDQRQHGYGYGYGYGYGHSYGYGQQGQREAA